MASKGSLLQLIARGEMDDKLIDKDIRKTLFKGSINKITNFSEASFSLYPENSPSWGDTITFKVGKYADLLTNIYLVLELPELSVTNINGLSENERTSTYRVRWNEFIGNSIINKIILRIGGQKIDEYSGEYIQFHTDLYDTNWSKLCMLGHDISLIRPNTKIDKQYIYVPLKFFFCDNINKALPIYALNYHDIEIEIKLNTWDKSYYVLKEVTDETSASESKTSKNYFAHTNDTITKKNFMNLRLDCNYIFLDDEERNYFKDNNHEILITQVQYQESSVLSNQKIFLNFNNPIKELFFVIQKQENRDLGEIFNFSGKSKYLPVGTTEFTERLWEQIPHKHLLDKASLQFNGVDRVTEKDYKYWHLVQNYEHYRNTLVHNIYAFSFGLLNKENMGSCNFSELENVCLTIKLSESETKFIHYSNADTITVGPENNNIFKIYGINYNIFKIQDGMGELMFPY
jgi:hypothetical protein